MSRRAARGAPSLRDVVLRLLARREYFRAELAARVRATYGRVAGETPELELQALLDECERNGWLSDQRAAEQVVRAGKRRYGAARLARNMLARGADAPVVAQALASLRVAVAAGAEEDSESARALAVLRRRFASAPVDAKQRAQRARFLAGRGFGEAVIEQILRLGDESQ